MPDIQDSLVTLELKRRALQLRKRNMCVTLNEYPGSLSQHRQFFEYYGLSNCEEVRRREERILDVGESEAYKKAPLVDRILSTDGVIIPTHTVIEESLLEPPVDVEGEGPRVHGAEGGAEPDTATQAVLPANSKAEDNAEHETRMDAVTLSPDAGDGPQDVPAADGS